MNNSFVITYKNKFIADFKYPEFLGYCRKFDENNILVVDTNCILELEILESMCDIKHLIKVIHTYMDSETLIDLDITTSFFYKNNHEVLKEFIKFLNPIDYYGYYVKMVFPDIVSISEAKVNKYISARVKSGIKNLYVPEMNYVYSMTDDIELYPKLIKYGLSKGLLFDPTFNNFIYRISSNISQLKDKLDDFDYKTLENAVDVLKHN